MAVEDGEQIAQGVIEAVINTLDRIDLGTVPSDLVREKTRIVRAGMRDEGILQRCRNLGLGSITTVMLVESSSGTRQRVEASLKRKYSSDPFRRGYDAVNLNSHECLVLDIEGLIIYRPLSVVLPSPQFSAYGAGMFMLDRFNDAEQRVVGEKILLGVDDDDEVRRLGGDDRERAIFLTTEGIIRDATDQYRRLRYDEVVIAAPIALPRRFREVINSGGKIVPYEGGASSRIMTTGYSARVEEAAAPVQVVNGEVKDKPDEIPATRKEGDSFPPRRIGLKVIGEGGGDDKYYDIPRTILTGKAPEKSLASYLGSGDARKRWEFLHCDGGNGFHGEDDGRTRGERLMEKKSRWVAQGRVETKNKPKHKNQKPANGQKNGKKGK